MSSPRKVSQMKALFVVYFDSLRMVPEQYRTHPLRLVLTRKDKVIQTESFGSPGMESCPISILRNFEVTLKPTSSKLGYKPCLLNVRLESVASKEALVDAQIDLARYIKGEGGELVKMNINGAEPPCVLLVALRGMSAELAAKRDAEAREKERVEAIARIEAAKAAQTSSPGPAAAAAADDDDALQTDNEVSQAVVVAQAVERDDNATRKSAALGALEEEAMYAAQSEGPAIEIRSLRAGEFEAHHDSESDDEHGDGAATENGTTTAAGGDNRSDTASASGSTAKPASTPQKQGSDKYAAATSKAERDRMRQNREKRREERKSRASLARVERERRVEEASLTLQQAVAGSIQEIRDSVLVQARIEIEGRKCTAPRAAQRIIAALDDQVSEMLRSAIPNRDSIHHDAAPAAGVKSLDSDSDEDTDAAESERIARNAARPLLPPEAAFVLFVHDLIVLLRWEVSPTPQHHCTLGAWMHTLLLVLNHVLQNYAGEELASLLPQIVNARLNANTVGGGWIDADAVVRDTLLAAAGQSKSDRAALRKNRRWWRSLRRPRVFGGGKKSRRPADALTPAGTESAVPGEQTIVSQIVPQLPEHAGTERSMGSIVGVSALFHSIGQRLDAMWGAHEERTIGARSAKNTAATSSTNNGKKSAAAAAAATEPTESERLSSEEAFPVLSRLPVNVFADGVQPAVQRRAAQSPLWDLFRELVDEGMPKTYTAENLGPFANPRESPLNDTLKSIGAVLAFELDMALHELLVQCVQLHVDSLPDLAFAALAPLPKRPADEYASPDSRHASPERSVSHAMQDAAMYAETAEAAAMSGSAAGSAPAFAWLRSALRGLYEELVASELGPEAPTQHAPSVDRGYIWNNPLSVQLASDIMRMVLEQLSILTVNENHRRLTANLGPAPKAHKKAKGPQPKFAFTPIGEDGCNRQGERVFSSIDDGLHLKERIDAIEAWLDGLPVALGQGCRAALLPLRSLCDLLILPPDVFLDETTREGALAPLPAPIQRALFAAMHPATWEHEDDVKLAQDARAALSTHILCTQVPDDITVDKKGVPSAPLPDDCEASAVALPFALVFRSPERDFSFLDMLTLPSPCYGSVDLTLRVLDAYQKVLAARRKHAKNAKALKELPPPPPASYAPTALTLTQSLDGYAGHMAAVARDAEEQRALAVTARWDTANYRESIGLSATDEMRREEQLLDTRRGPDVYKAPDTVLTGIRSEWDTHGDRRSVREEACRLVAAALIPTRRHPVILH